MRPRLLIPVLALTLLGAACSVSTPRRDVATVDPGAGLASDGIDPELASTAGEGSAEASVVDGSAGGAALAGGAAGKKGSVPGGGAGAAGGARAPAAGQANPGAAAAAPVTGVTKDSVTVSIIAGFSGPLGPVLEKSYQGLETWRDDVNDHGGIHGRKVVLKKVDHKETADGGVAACKEALSNGSLFAMVPEGVDATLTAINCLDRAGMPTVYYSGTTDPKWKVAFADIITSSQGGKVLASFVARSLGGAGKKVGVLYVNQLAYKAAADTFVPEAGRLGADVAVVEPVEPNQASFTSQLLHMRDAGVKILVISATTETVGILRDARAIGYSPQFTGWGFQFDFVTVGARDLFDGVTGIRSYATVDSAAYQRYASRMEARGRGRDRAQDLEGLPAYGHGLMLGEVLQQAGANPTRESIVTGADTIKGYDNGILPPITWGPGNHEGARAGFPVVCCSSDYTWKSLGPAKTEF